MQGGFVWVSLLAILLSALVYFASAANHRLHTRCTPEELDTNFNSFERKFNRKYSGTTDRTHRRKIFENNYNKILAHNQEADRGLHSYRLGVTDSADMTNDEYNHRRNGFKSQLTAHRGNTSTSTTPVLMAVSLPASVDWRLKNAVTNVKDQGQCGCCYAFSAVTAIEGQKAIKTGKLVSLSPQNIADCSSSYGNLGCDGGTMDNSFQYVKDRKGVDTDSCYPFSSANGQVKTCRFSSSCIGATLTGFTDIPSGSESQLQTAVANVGPISVAIDASSQSFQLYSSGIYNNPGCGNTFNSLDHGVTVVGYGSQNGQDYWIVKNSWSTGWGEKGYVRMSRNKNNQCGIALMASYPTGVN